MFQTGIHIALQTLASDVLTWLMLQVTATGYTGFVIGMVLVVMFGVSLRKGFLLFQIIAWTAFITDIAKNFFSLPRPFFADSRVTCLDPHWHVATPFCDMGGKGFFSLPDPTVIDAFRQQGLSFGFPSGHVSGACATWGGLAIVFQKKILYGLAPVMVALLAFSRLYLGVHFLADIGGGLLLGVLALLVAGKLFSRDGERFFAAARARFFASLPAALYLLFLFVIPMALALLGLFSAAFAGIYVGMNVAFTLAQRAGLPAEQGSKPVRLARIALGGFLFWLFSLGLQQALTLIPAIAGSGWVRFLSGGLGAFLTIWGNLKVCLKLGLYRQERSTTPSPS